MKHLFLFFIIYSACLYSHNQTIVPAKSVSMPTAAGHLNLTLYINNAQDARSNNGTSVVNAQANTQTETPISKALAQLDLKTKLAHFDTGFLSRYKWHLLLGTSAITYGILCYIIVSGNSYLGQAELWSSWRAELSLDQLLSIPQEQFSQDLLQEIHRRYTTSDTISDLMTPLSLFLLALEKEEEQIKWYQYAYSWLTYLKITKVLPFSKVRFAKINERIQRISYLKNSFHTWIAKFHYEQPRILEGQEEDLNAYQK